MPLVEIKCPNGPDSLGTIVLVDGHELEHVVRVSFTAEVNSVARVEAEVLVQPGSVFEGRADLHITLVAEKGLELIHTVEPDGTTRYRAVGLPS